MEANELDYIKKESDQFIKQNKSRFDIITEFLRLLNNISKENFAEIIEFVQDHKNIFFNDHSSAIFFFLNIIRFSKFIFKRFELILDVGLHFSKEIRNNNTTELELLKICMYFPNSINYLFLNNFFSIESIIEFSTQLPIFFIKFYPEIEQYDPEYSKLREKNIFSEEKNPNNEQRISLFNFVKENPEKHVFYRNLNYHPSPLHKAIREDDIDTFQSLLSQNNFCINHQIEFSFYERAKTMDKDLSLIQIAAIYGSIKIFKFLWMQEDIIINNNLLNYAYSGYNFEIIHLCEVKCSYENICIQSIFLHRNDLVDYYIENYGNEIHEKNENVLNKLQNFFVEIDDNENLYNKLSYNYLKMAVFAYNYKIIIPCFQKIVLITKFIENIEDFENSNFPSFLKCCEFDLNFFEFIFNQRKIDVDVFKCGCYYSALGHCLENSANDAFKFLFFALKKKLNLIFLLESCIEKNHDLAFFILDLQTKDDHVFKEISKKIKIRHLLLALNYYNEDIVVKLIESFKFFGKKRNIVNFIKTLTHSISIKMIISLFSKIFSSLSNDVLYQMTVVFKDFGFQAVSDFITNKNDKIDGCD